MHIAVARGGYRPPWRREGQVEHSGSYQSGGHRLARSRHGSGIPADPHHSNGNGGYHLLILFDGPYLTERVFAFGKWLVRDWKSLGLVGQPEIFPKQARIDAGKCGNWLRLPGRHHTRDHYSRAWDGSGWLSPVLTIARILDTTGSPLSIVPPEALKVPDRSHRTKGTLVPAQLKAHSVIDETSDHEELVGALDAIRDMAVPYNFVDQGWTSVIIHGAWRV